MKNFGIGIAITCIAASVTAQDGERFATFSVDAAVAHGLKEKAVALYELRAPAKWGWPPTVGGYTTPFLRVAIAANAAKRRYKPFTPADVTLELIAPEIEIIAASQKLAGAVIANVETIVLMPKGSKDRGQAIHPIRTEPITDEYKNLFGYTAEGRGLVAVFPLSVWHEKNDVHVVFDRKLPSSQGAVGGCEDCAVQIRLKDVR